MANPTLSIVKGSSLSSLYHDSKKISKTIDNLNADKQVLLELANKLHSTLELDKLITLFKLEISPILNLDEVIYITPEEAHQQDIDTKGRHMVSYQLVLYKKKLGEIALIRRTRFDDKEQKFIEKILVAALLPLKNALEYQQAMLSALQDPLTGVLNRFSMDSVFSREIELSNRNQTPLSLIALDIDFFKQVNDTYGHTTGDCVLKHLTEAVKQCTRNTDILFRCGGEEFTLLLNNTSLEGARQLAERIRENVQNSPCICNGQSISVTVSMGISLFQSDDTQHTFFDRADKALYQAKETGRNQVVCG